MGATAILLIYSPWGKQSGAHMNPAITLTFTRLGKVAPRDALAYMVAQFAGGLAGVLIARMALGGRLAHPSVDYAATLPGPWGASVAFVAEAAISCLLVPGGPCGLQPSAPGGVHRHLRGPDGGHLHHGRGAAVRDEHEPGADPRLRVLRRRLDRPLDLLHGPTAGHAGGGPALPGAPRPAGRRLRQAPSPELEALHLLRVPWRPDPVAGAQGTNPHPSTL